MRIIGIVAIVMGVAAMVPSATATSVLSITDRLCVKGNPDSQSTNEPSADLIGCVTNQNATGGTMTDSYNSNTFANGGYNYYGFTTGYATYGTLGAVADIITVNGTPDVFYSYGGVVSGYYVAPEIATMTVSFEDQFQIFTTPGVHYFQPVMTLDGGAVSGIDSASISTGLAQGRVTYCDGLGNSFDGCGSTYGVSSGDGGYSVTSNLPAPIAFSSGDTISFLASLTVEAAAASVNDPGSTTFTGGSYGSNAQPWMYDYYTANEAATFGDTAALTGFGITDSSGQVSPYSFTAASGAAYFSQPAAPEPATWLLMFVGVALLGGGLQRQRRSRRL